MSQGYIKSTQNNYLAKSKDGSFEFSEVGLNFTKQLTDQLRVGMQLFMRDLGPVGNYKPQFDWYYLDYRLFDWLGIRAGRTKIPFGLYNETNDVDSARVPILLPQSIYPTGNRDYLLAQTGLELYGQIPLAGAGALEYRTYVGTIYMDVSNQSGITNFHVPYVVGGRLMWETPLEGLQAGGTLQALSLNGDFFIPESEAVNSLLLDAGLDPAPLTNTFVKARIPATLWVASVEYAAHELSLAAEYSRWNLSLDLEPPGSPFTPVLSTQDHRFYVMASYRVAPWFAPGAYYSVYLPDERSRVGNATALRDLAVTFRYDLTARWLFKVEGHLMRGTAGLDPALNDGVQSSELTRDWGLFLAKTTAHF